MSDLTPHDTFSGDTVHYIRESDEDQLREIMEKEGFTTEIPKRMGLYQVVFWTRCADKALVDNQEDPDIQCGSYFRNTTAGYTSRDRYNAFCFVWASHWDKHPTIHLNEGGVNSMKRRWNTKEIWWRLIEEFKT